MYLSQFSLLLALALGVTCLTIQVQDQQPKLAKRAWTALGCYTDNVSGRALPNSVSVPGGSAAMTNELCQTACQAAGYSIAGTEYAGECWCGNSFVNGGASTSSGDCNMACNGNSAEKCGGPNRLTAYSSSGGGTTPSTPSLSSIAKRGLCYNNNNPSGNAVYANMFAGEVSWAYDWGYPSWSLDSSIEFVPMLWGYPPTDLSDWTAAVKAAGTKNILGYNEPDLTYSASSNMLPAVAATGWLLGMQPFANTGVRISTPNVLWNNWNSWSSGGSYNSRVWTQYFMGNCTGCHYDFAAIHYYGNCYSDDNSTLLNDCFTTNLTNAYEFFNLPIWITEFQCYGSDEQQADFLNAVVPWMDSQSFVERYAYFGTFPGYLLDAAGTALSLAGAAFVDAA